MDRQGHVSLSAHLAIICYEASATKGGRAYRALVSSGYVQRATRWPSTSRRR
jgi:hypothetical protein